jgi:hypothetical protein
LCQPASQCHILAIQRHRRRNPFDQVGRALDILGGQGMLNRLAGEPMPLKPDARPLVEIGYIYGGEAAYKPLSQHFGKQLMINDTSAALHPVG